MILILQNKTKQKYPNQLKQKQQQKPNRKLEKPQLFIWQYRNSYSNLEHQRNCRNAADIARQTFWWVHTIMAKSRARLSRGSPHALSSRFLPSLCPITDSYPPFPKSSLTSSPSEAAQLAKLTSAERSPQCPTLPPAAPLWAGLVTAYISHRISWGQHQSIPGMG